MVLWKSFCNLPVRHSRETFHVTFPYRCFPEGRKSSKFYDCTVWPVDLEPRKTC